MLNPAEPAKLLSMASSSWNVRTDYACMCFHTLKKVYTPPRGGILPYIGYIGMCGPKGYGFSAVLVINRVSILADFSHFGHK